MRKKWKNEDAERIIYAKRKKERKKERKKVTGSQRTIE